MERTINWSFVQAALHEKQATTNDLTEMARRAGCQQESSIEMKMGLYRTGPRIHWVNGRQFMVTENLKFGPNTRKVKRCRYW